MVSIPAIIKNAGRYTASHPRLLADIARHAFGGRLAIPLDVLRWATTLAPADKAKDLTVLAQAPAIGVGATVDAMGTEVRVDAAIDFESVDISLESIKVAFRVHDLRASVLNNLTGNLAKMLASPFINLKKPASLLKIVPMKLPVILEANDDRFVIDLMKIGSIAKNPKVQKAIAAITPVLSIGQIKTEDDLLVIGLKASPSKIFKAVQALCA